MSHELRTQLVAIALEWEIRFGIAPSVTSAISEYDAALLVGCSEQDYCACRKLRTAVSKGHDFTYQNHAVSSESKIVPKWQTLVALSPRLVKR